MIRILHVFGGLDMGGAETMIMNIYRNIDREKIQFDFVTHSGRNQAYVSEIEQLGGKIYFFPKIRIYNLPLLINEWKAFFEEHKEYKILHSHVRSYASIYIPIAKKYGLKTIIHSHSTSNGKGMKSFVKAILQYPLRYEADYFMGCSKEAGKWLFGEKIVNDNKYYTVKNAIDTQQYLYNREVRNIYRKQLGFEEGETVFVHVGRLHEAKNHMFLLEVFAELQKNNPKAWLLLVGDGELSLEIKNQTKKMHLVHKVKMLGSRKDVQNILSAADAFLFPSKWEGLPVTVVEAQASGLPCFVSDKITKEVGISELVKFLPIDKGTQVWIDAIKETDLTRKNVIDKIIQAGFDIKKSVEWLTKFYEEING